MIYDNNTYRIHHVRPRFKNDVEGVLLFMANEIFNLGEMNKKLFVLKLDNIIKTYPNNYTKKAKTIANWRTEISALFGLFQYKDDKKKPSRLCDILATHQDLIQFFRYFLYYFQYPGGHLKTHETCNMIKKGIRFHPTQYILRVLLEGRKITKSNFGVTKAEATHIIFNDLRVTRDNRTPKKTVYLILNNRETNHVYDCSGDVVRYAGDILDYMELAELVEIKPNYKYYPKMQYFEVFQTYIQAQIFFPEYELFYSKKNLNASDIKLTQKKWFDFINSNLDNNLFKTDISKLIFIKDNKTDKDIIQLSIEKINDKKSKNIPVKTKEIGDIGEAIVIHHEKTRITNLNRKDIIHLIKKIPDHLGMGYDVKSFLGENNDFRNIHIEVKTTISKCKLSSYSFHMTTNEWQSADSYQDSYFIYRLMISFGNIELFIIKNPVEAYKQNLIKMVPKNGASIKYKEESGKWVKVLL
jgi:hypothetical protein